MSDVLTKVVDTIWAETVGNVADGMHWLKSVLFGEFEDNRPLSAIVADMLVSFVPGVVILTSLRDAIAVILRLAQHPEKREDLLEWILLIACVITIALPLMAAAAGAVAMGVGAVVTGIAGSELAAALRAVILLLIKRATSLIELIQFLNKFIRGDIIKFLRAIRFAHYEKAILHVIKDLTGRLINIVKKLRIKLSNAEILGVKVSDHVDAVKTAITKLANWEGKFYAVQKDALRQVPKAIVELQARLDKVLAQAFGKEEHIVEAGVQAPKPNPVDVKPQEVPDVMGNSLPDPKAKVEPTPPSTPSEKPNTVTEKKVDTVVGDDYALVNGNKVKPVLAQTLFHGTNKNTLGYPSHMSNHDVAQDLYRNGLPGRGNNLDLKAHADGGQDTAFRGTTQLIMTPDGQAGAILWADEGGLLIKFKNVMSYDVNAALEGKVKNIDGSFGGNKVHGEQEFAVPGRILPDQIDEIYDVTLSPRGRLDKKIIARSK